MVRARFAELMAVGAADVPLDEAALLISAELQPGLDLIEWLAELDELAGSCPTPTPDGVARHLFADGHFAGNRDAYYDCRNSCLDRVIERRVGIPISLSVLMIEVAKRVGVRLGGVGMPAHFLVCSLDEPHRFFDPFDRGTELDADGARTLFMRVTRGQAGWNDSYLVATPPESIVIRMLNNLHSIFQERSDALRLTNSATKPMVSSSSASS